MFHSVKILFVLILLVCISCSEKNKKSTETIAQAPTTVSGPTVPGLPQEIYTKLLDSCTYVDYIFHNLPFSLSQDSDADINQNIMFIDIAKAVGQLDQSCKPAARKFFHINGKIVYDVDVYLSEKCNYYVFLDKSGKPVYANQMAETGRNFYNNIIKQVTGATSNGGQQ